MKCTKCGKIINDDSNFCFYCGNKTEPKNIKKHYIVRWIIGIFVVMAIVLLSIISSENLKDYKNGKEDNIVEDYKPGDYAVDKKFIDETIISSVVNLYCDTSVYNIETNEGVFGGSGTITTPDGVILTNAHILPENTSADDVVCIVIIPDKETGMSDSIYLAKPVKKSYLNDEYDLIFLKIYSEYVDSEGYSYGDYPIKFPNTSSLSVIECASEYVTLGEEIKIYGYPSITEDSLTITEGIVSAFSEYGKILTSAKINPGNSGGLAIDAAGCPIGVPSATIIEGFENLGVIIPTDWVYDYLEEDGLDWEEYYY